MTVAELELEIKAIQEYIDVLNLPVANEKDFILRCYIETESLSKTKKCINHIVKPGGNKYQVNDIRDLILAEPTEADGIINDLAYKIYRANKRQSGRR